MSHDQVDQFLKELREGLPNCQNASVFFGRPETDDMIISCYRESVEGMQSLCAGFQNQSTKPFGGFMDQIYATAQKPRHERLVISDYDLLADDDPLKAYYPPFFKAVGDYVLWGPKGEFLGWIGMLGTEAKIGWADYANFIAEVVERWQEALVNAYYTDFVK